MNTYCIASQCGEKCNSCSRHVNASPIAPVVDWSTTGCGGSGTATEYNCGPCSDPPYKMYSPCHIVEPREAQIIEAGELHVCGNCGRTLPYNREGKEVHHWVCNYCHWCGYKLKGGIFDD